MSFWDNKIEDMIDMIGIILRAAIIVACIVILIVCIFHEYKIIKDPTIQTTPTMLRIRIDEEERMRYVEDSLISARLVRTEELCDSLLQMSIKNSKTHHE